MFTIPFPVVHSSDTFSPYTYNQGFTQSSLSSLFLFFLQNKGPQPFAAPLTGVTTAVGDTRLVFQAPAGFSIGV